MNLIPTLTEWQQCAVAWLRNAFGTMPADCAPERAHRFLEEALECAQAAGCTREDALQLVEHVYAGPPGAFRSEAGGTLLTLLLLCASRGESLNTCMAEEHARVNTPEVMNKCRAKNAAKDPNSPLPGRAP